MVRLLLHIEGLAILLLALYLYASHSLSWPVFFILLFVPDLAALGYLVDLKTGAKMYNYFHTTSIPVVFIIAGLFLSSRIALAIGLIWLAHIGMDRMLGYGLKYPTRFKDTHLSRL
ncbi:hypothetical protein AV656_09800 [Bhargavaea cecembensis]|uniref:DUF4260 domain-containing protein n=1 Tax=Bhargavaea cecembensis TaxID=394098 RepID=A0A163F2Q9_9BACL|nr:DUF4260 domain-containing protein [Bhargavaea cecembensis]KZE37811.1 hypothetical protein AV656_09800 [Bhargavaea cecembensis]